MKRIILFIFIPFTLFSCEDNVRQYGGYTQKEMEYLLAADELKIWERISKAEDGTAIDPDDCGMDNFLIFLQDIVGQPKPLLYAYNPQICDSLDFCLQHPDLCQSDTTLCNANPEFCETLNDGVLYIGSWYAKEPFITNSRSDTLIFEINNKIESIHVTSISSQNATFLYKNRTGNEGSTITEVYKFSMPINK